MCACELKSWGQIAKLLQIKIYLSDLGITWHSCSGMYPEAIAQVIPKSVCGSCSNPHGTTLGGEKITSTRQQIFFLKNGYPLFKTKRARYFKYTFGGVKWVPVTQKWYEMSKTTKSSFSHPFEYPGPIEPHQKCF